MSKYVLDTQVEMARDGEKQLLEGKDKEFWSVSSIVSGTDEENDVDRLNAAALDKKVRQSLNGIADDSDSLPTPDRSPERTRTDPCPTTGPPSAPVAIVQPRWPTVTMAPDGDRQPEASTSAASDFPPVSPRPSEDSNEGSGPEANLETAMDLSVARVNGALATYMETGGLGDLEDIAIDLEDIVINTPLVSMTRTNSPGVTPYHQPVSPETVAAYMDSATWPPPSHQTLVPSSVFMRHLPKVKLRRLACRWPGLLRPDAPENGTGVDDMDTQNNEHHEQADAGGLAILYGLHEVKGISMEAAQELMDKGRERTPEERVCTLVTCPECRPTVLFALPSILASPPAYQPTFHPTFHPGFHPTFHPASSHAFHPHRSTSSIRTSGLPLVGHTQFSKIAATLEKKDATTVDELIHAINKSFPNVKTWDCDAMLDIKTFLGNASNDLEQHGCPHGFTFTNGHDDDSDNFHNSSHSSNSLHNTTTHPQGLGFLFNNQQVQQHTQQNTQFQITDYVPTYQPINQQQYLLYTGQQHPYHTDQIQHLPVPPTLSSANLMATCTPMMMIGPTTTSYGDMYNLPVNIEVGVAVEWQQEDIMQGVSQEALVSSPASAGEIISRALRWAN
ncbi:Hypp6480 [Branchiostoma lanceolatum]|uniref:Hypp6480 protein n=1 Tax=Branchiostoma lanceolatum TaxID=7740 RepID=A0A8J9YUW8_BRALA|nr:Hypp6480 [Branchiostoma lanceolatum]